MYLERIGKHFKITEETGDHLTEGQTESLLTKGTSNTLTAKKKVTSNLNVKLNQRIKRRINLIIGIFDF